jgi:hypothetical protein
MGYFFDIEMHSEKLGPIKQKGRVYRVVDRKGDLRWYEIAQETIVGGEKLCDASFAVWDLEMFPIPREDLDRALTRRSKAS